MDKAWPQPSSSTEMFHPQQNQLGRDDPHKIVQPPLIVHLANLDYALDETTAMLNELEGKLSTVLGDPEPQPADTPKTYNEGSSEVSRRLSGYTARVQNNIAHIKDLMERLEV